MAMDFVFSSKIVLVFSVGVSSKINTGLYVPNENWFTRFDYFSLHFESAIGVNVIENPNTIEIGSSS